MKTIIIIAIIIFTVILLFMFMSKKTDAKDAKDAKSDTPSYPSDLSSLSIKDVSNLDIRYLSDVQLSTLKTGQVQYGLSNSQLITIVPAQLSLLLYYKLTQTQNDVMFSPNYRISIGISEKEATNACVSLTSQILKLETDQLLKLTQKQ